MESTDFHTLKAMLDWQVDLGATEAIMDAPVNRYEIPKAAPKPAAAPVVETQAPPVVAKVPEVDTVGIATGLANGSAGAKPGNCWIKCLQLSVWTVPPRRLSRPSISPTSCRGARRKTAIQNQMRLR